MNVLHCLCRLDIFSTPKISPDIKKVYIALGILTKYRKRHWLLSSLCWEKSRLPPKEEIKCIKAETLARSIAIVKHAANEGGRKRYSSPAREPSVKKKLKTSSSARKGLPTIEKLVIDLNFSKENK